MEPTAQARPQDWFDAVDEAALRRRRGAKWNRFGGQALAAWVADMDFPPAPPVAAALAEMAASGDYGYPFLGEPTSVAIAFAGWAARRYGWSVDPDRVMLLVDVLQPIAGCIEAFSEAGDGVLIQTPIYPPFLRALEMTGRVLVDHPLGSASDGYPLDTDALKNLDPRTRIVLLCNPHNPSGRAFRREELTALAEVAIERDLLVISDEIHADLVYQPHRHIAFASLSPEAAARTITLTSSTKTFNIAGLRIALAIFGSPTLQERFTARPRFLWGGASSAGALASVAAWETGDVWVDALVDYLDGNRRFVGDFLTASLPELGHALPEATYLSWLDGRAMPSTAKGVSPAEFFLQHGVALNEGADFGPRGEGFTRLNFATSRALLTRILERMAEAIAHR